MKQISTLLTGALLLLSTLDSAAASEAESKQRRDSLRQARREAKARLEPEKGVQLIPANPPEESVEEPNRVMPTFCGGDLTTFRNWCIREMSGVNYINQAKDDSVVKLTFFIERDGTLTIGEVIQADDSYLLSAAIAALSASPRWTPGLEDGKPVRVRYTIPILYRKGQFDLSPDAGRSADGLWRSPVATRRQSEIYNVGGEQDD